MKHLTAEQFESAANKAVKAELRGVGWWVYEHYETREEGDQTFVVAPVSFDTFFRPESTEEHAIQEDDMQSQMRRSYSGRSPQEDAITIYAPLMTPELVLDLAELAEKKITSEVVRSWAQIYGLLGFPDDDIVRFDDGFIKYQVKNMGRKDNVQRFAEAAGEIRGCLRIYEAMTADEDLNLEELLASYAILLPRKAFLPFGAVEGGAGEERSWLAHVLSRLVQMRLEEYCYPMFVAYTRGGVPAGRFALAWGFRGLIGALWLHVAWLLEAEGQRVRRCKLPGCLRVVHFEPGETPFDPGLKKNARGKYKTRSDREFCKGRGCKQKYHYRKKAGWLGYA
jgi:hypothetical protein